MRALPAITAAGAALTVCMLTMFGAASWNDTSYQREIVMARRAAASAVQAGRLPLWWDGAGFGVPLLEDPRAAALYPGSWISTGGWGVDLVGVLHLFFLGLATSALTAALWRNKNGAEAPRGACVLAAALSGTSGVGIAALVGGWLASLAWLLIALAILVEWSAAKRRRLCLAVALVAIVLGGGIELMLVAVVAIAAKLALTRADRAGLFLALAIAVMVSAAQWLPWMMLGAAGISAGPLFTAAGMFAIVGASLLAPRWLAKTPVFVGVFVAVCALGLVTGQRDVRDRAALDRLPAWLAAPLPEALATASRAGAPLRVFCPPRTAARDLAAGEPGEPLFTASPSLRCAQRAWASGSGEAALWRRGAGAGGRLLRRLSIPLAIVPSSTVNAVGFQQLGKRDSWALVALPSRPLTAVYPSTFSAADAPAALAAVVPPPGQPGAAAAQLVVEGAPALGASPRPRAEPSTALPAERGDSSDDQHVEHAHLAHEPVEVTAPLLDGAPPEPCSLRAWHPGEISLTCPALAVPSIAAIASAWAPGWQVTVDGAQATPVRVEALLRGVALPGSSSAAAAFSATTSSHSILWRYRPPAWPLASSLSALGLALLALLASGALIAWLPPLRAILQRRR